MNLLKIIASESIGGERRIGCGEIRNCEDPLPFQVKPEKDCGKFGLVSLLSPKNVEELDACEYYHVISRGGRKTTNDGTLQRVKMIAEGTVTSCIVQGEVHDIRAQMQPGEQVQNIQFYARIGKAICLPLHPNLSC